MVIVLPTPFEFPIKIDFLWKSLPYFFGDGYFMNDCCKPDSLNKFNFRLQNSKRLQMGRAQCPHVEYRY